MYSGAGRRISMLPLVMEGAVAVDALESVRAEIISLGLNQIRAKSLRAECVNIFEGVDERWDRDAAFDRASDRPTEARESVDHF